jgi:hypothetical protein
LTRIRFLVVFSHTCFSWLILVTFWGASSAPNKLCFQKLLRLIFLKFPAAPSKLDCVRRERSAATCCRVVSADKKEKIQVQCRSVLIEDNILIALFIKLRFSLDYFTGWPDHSAALFAI